MQAPFTSVSHTGAAASWTVYESSAGTGEAPVGSVHPSVRPSAKQPPS